MNSKFKNRVNQQFALAGVLGVTALSFQNPVYARDLDSQSTHSGNSINLDDGDIITANINYSGASNEFSGITGIYNQKGTQAQINLGTSSQINTSSNTNSAGIYIGANDSSLTADALKINVKVAQNGHAYGIKVNGNNANINLGTGSEITTESPRTGLYETVGILLESNASISANKITVKSIGYYSGAAVKITGNGTVDLGSGSTIIGNIESQAEEGLFKAQSINITGTVSTNSGGKIEIGANSYIKNSTAIYLSQGANDLGGTVSIKGTTAEKNNVEGFIFTAGNKSKLDFADTNILGYLEASIGSSVNFANSSLTKASNYGYGIHVNNGSTVTFTGENKIHRANVSDTLIYNNAGTITGTAKMDMLGNIFADGSSLIDLNMTQGSIWTGSAGKLYTEQAGTINLSFSGSLWNMSADSQINKLSLNNSTVDFIENRLGSKLSVKELSGNGTFIMDVDLVSNTGVNSGDILLVTDSSQGNHKVKIRNQGALPTTGNETLTIVKTPDGQATFSLFNNRARAELGGYIYDIRKNDNQKDWELYAARQENGNNELSSTALAAGNFLNTNYLLNYAETQTLLQRMGELRQSESSGGDAWIRAYTGKFDSFGGAMLSGFDMDYNGVQTGIDKQISLDDDSIYLGIMGGFTKADSKFTAGNGNVKGYHLGFYGTYVASNDFYIDGIIKYGSLKNTFDVLDTENQQVDGSARGHTYGISLEVGKRFYFNETKAGFYLEPQAELSYTHQESAQTQASNGLTVDLNSYDSTIGRISALIGYEIKNSANPVNLYFKTGYVTEMSGDVGYALNGSRENHDFGGDWWNNGFGITTQINKKHNLYLEGMYATGNKFDQIQFNAGYRYSF